MTSGDTPKSLERFNSKSLKTQGEVLLRRQRGCRKGQTTEMVRRERGRERKRKSERDRNTERVQALGWGAGIVGRGLQGLEAPPEAMLSLQAAA